MFGPKLGFMLYCLCSSWLDALSKLLFREKAGGSGERLGGEQGAERT